MASIENRSRYVVGVRNRPDLTADFPFSATSKVEAQVAWLRAQGYKPRVSQREDAILVRIRERGHPELQATVASYDEANALIRKVEEERSRGLYVDYGRSLKVTFADLMIRYLDDELGIKAGGQSLKGREVYTYIVEAMLRASGARGRQMLAARHARLDAQGLWHPGGRARSERPGNELDWIHRPFAQITVSDIEDWIEERLECVEPATVDRELDEISKIFRLAVRTWGYPLAANPMDGVRRPRYFNERDRRLRNDEEERLLAAAREEDRRDVLEAATQAGAARQLQDAELDRLHPSSRKRRVVGARQIARERLVPDALTSVPLFEALVSFFMMTAARRSEALTLTWANVDLHGQTALLPETKNGRPRTLPLRQDLITLLEHLPRDGDKVFPVTMHRLRRAWTRICERAGITDLRIHDLRHEAISRVAELGAYSQAGAFTLVDLQAFSGHRDLRMLLRYAHLCAGQFAQRLDAAFAAKAAHKGRRRLAESEAVSLVELVSPTGPDAQGNARRSPTQSIAPTGAPASLLAGCEGNSSHSSPAGPASVAAAADKSAHDAIERHGMSPGGIGSEDPLRASGNVVHIEAIRRRRTVSAVAASDAAVSVTGEAR